MIHKVPEAEAVAVAFHMEKEHHSRLREDLLGRMNHHLGSLVDHRRGNLEVEILVVDPRDMEDSYCALKEGHEDQLEELQDMRDMDSYCALMEDHGDQMEELLDMKNQDMH